MGNEEGEALFDDLSGSDSDVSYKEKFENIKGVMNQLHKDLLKEKMKNKGIGAVTKILDDQRAENAKLVATVKKLQRGIDVLQNRLENHDISSNVSIEEGEFLRPQMSKQLFDNLVAANAQYAKRQKFIDIDPEEVEKQARELQELRSEYCIQKKELERLNEELQKARDERLASADDKDRIILGLQREVKDLSESKKTQSIICETLSTETVSLRTQLKETMKQMQGIMQRMEMGGMSGESSIRSLSHSEAEIASLKNEIKLRDKKLAEKESQFKKVVDMNGQWQTYNKQRDEHVSQLKKEIAELKGKQRQNNLAKDSDANVEIYKQRLDSIQNENAGLKHNIERVSYENRNLKQEMKKLKEGSFDHDREKIQLYEAQIKVITEDFRQERNDRAREHERAEKLQEELAETKAQLENLQRLQMDSFSQRRQNSLQNYETQYNMQAYGRPLGVAQSGYVARGRRRNNVSYECDSNIDSNRSEDVVDDSSHDDVVDSQNELQCPKCNKSFPIDQHPELLDHLGEC